VTGTLAIYRRELAGLFLAPLAWILLTLALLFNAFFFLLYLEGQARGEVNLALSLLLGGAWPFWILMAILPPLLTMRMISEESRSGMLEFLLTAPVSDAAVVCGKFLAATTFMAVLWGSVLLYALTLGALGTSPDWGPVLGGFMGSVLTSGLFCGVGILASAGTGTPLLAAFLAFIANLFILLMPLLGSLTEASWIHDLVKRVDVIAHFQKSFLVGVFDTAQVSFFLCWTALFVFLAVRLIETRRWR